MKPKESLRLFSLLLLLLLLLTGCNPLLPYLEWKIDARPGDFQVTPRRVSTQTMRDGVQLQAWIYLPVDVPQAPTVLVRAPLPDMFAVRQIADGFGRFFGSRGYAVVIQGIRGKFKSAGSYTPLVNERNDGDDTLQWLKQQVFYNGRIVMWGGSVFGFTQWAIADLLPTTGSALSIQIASSNFQEMFYPGGAFALASAIFWAARDKSESVEWRGISKQLSTLPITEIDNRTIGQSEYFDSWARRDASYWQKTTAPPVLEELRTPVLLLAGWFDAFLPAQLDDFKRLQRSADKKVATQSRLIVGPWSHAESVVLPERPAIEDYRIASIRTSLEWFDQQLLGYPVPADQQRVKLYLTGLNQWRSFDSWPVPERLEKRFQLSDRGRLLPSGDDKSDSRCRTFSYDPANPVPTRGGASIGPLAGVFEQAEIEMRNDVLVFSSEPLAQDLLSIGEVRVVLDASSSASWSDFTAKLTDVWPDGRSWNVSDGIIRSEFSERSRKQLSIELWPIGHLFKKGHRLRLQISSSNFPGFDRNLNNHSKDLPQVAEQRVCFGSKEQSFLEFYQSQ